MDTTIALRSGHVLVNGSEVEVLSSTPTSTPTPLTRLLRNCTGERLYRFELTADAPASSVQQLLGQVPKSPSVIERVVFGSKPAIPMLRLMAGRASGHWVRLSVEPTQIKAFELQRDVERLSEAPVVASEVSFQGLTQVQTWLRATCGTQPCTGVILALSPEQKSSAIELVLRAVAASGPALMVDLRALSKNDSNELASVGRLPPAVIQGIVRASYDNFRHCYESGLARNTKLVGRVTVRFVIELDGSVRSSVAESPSFPDPEVARCIAERFAQLHFPRPDGGIVTVVYPIELSPG